MRLDVDTGRCHPALILDRARLFFNLACPFFNLMFFFQPQVSFFQPQGFCLYFNLVFFLFFNLTCLFFWTSHFLTCLFSTSHIFFSTSHVFLSTLYVSLSTCNVSFPSPLDWFLFGMLSVLWVNVGFLWSVF